MKLGGRACNETLSEAAIAKYKEKTKDIAGGVRLEQEVRRQVEN